MIGKLTGILDTIQSDMVIVDVNGVGYVVHVSPRTLSFLKGVGERVTILIHTHVREDNIQLYGFADMLERQWFNLLTTVQGVGNKVALALLGACPPERLPLIIASQDKAALTQADGVGPKLATRILTELKDKAGDIALGPAAQAVSAKPAKGAQKDGVDGSSLSSDMDEAAEEMIEDFNHEAEIADAVSALLALGYSRSEAYSAVTTVAARSESDLNIQQLVTMGLKELVA